MLCLSNINEKACNVPSVMLQCALKQKFNFTLCLLILQSTIKCPLVKVMGLAGLMKDPDLVSQTITIRLGDKHVTCRMRVVNSAMWVIFNR